MHIYRFVGTIIMMNFRCSCQSHTMVKNMLCVECEEISGMFFEKPGADVFQSTSVFCKAAGSEGRKREMSPHSGRSQ